MSKHTEGPWHAGAGQQSKIVYGENGFAIGNAVVFHDKHSEVEAEANASLMAAAPDLLKALQTAIDCQDDSQKPVPFWVPNARAAIAKAVQS